MTTAVAASRPGVLTLGRVAAGLAGASAVVHLLQVTSTSLGSLVMAAMALACLPCGWHLWRSPTPGVWALTAAVDLAMALLHAQMLAAAPGAASAGMAGMHHTGQPVGLMWLGLGLGGTQLTLAGVAALRRRSL